MTICRSGERLTASMVNAGLLTSVQAASTGNLTVSTSDQDVPGVSLTFVSPVRDSVVIAWGVIDIETNGASDTFVGELWVDDGPEVHQVIWQGTGRATIGQTWRPVLLEGDSHILKLSCYKLGTANTVTVNGTNTKLVVAAGGIV